MCFSLFQVVEQTKPEAQTPPIPPHPVVQSPPPVQNTHPIPPSHSNSNLTSPSRVQQVLSQPSVVVQPQQPQPKDPLSRNNNQMLNNVLSQLLQSDHESAIASLLSSSDGQSSGTPASVEPLHHPRSPPLSVPSNCSYPATPAVPPANTNPTSNNSVTTPSMFEGTGDATNTVVAAPPPPRGLAAYLQKSRRPVTQSPTGEEITQATSPWTADRRLPVVPPGSSSTANGGGGGYSSLSNTPSGHERGNSASGKDGKDGKRGIFQKFDVFFVVHARACLTPLCLPGRRRRSELEELSIWHVKDQPATNNGGCGSSNNATAAPNSHAANRKQQPVIAHPSPIPESSPDVNEIGGATTFTEPLVERVKRRRQASRKNNADTTPTITTSNNSNNPSSSHQRGGKSSGKRQRRDTSPSDPSDMDDQPQQSQPRKRMSVLCDDDDDDAGGGSSSSCLTDSSLPGKQSLQRLVEEAKGRHRQSSSSTSRPPSLARLEGITRGVSCLPLWL